VVSRPPGAALPFASPPAVAEWIGDRGRAGVGRARGSVGGGPGTQPSVQGLAPAPASAPLPAEAAGPPVVDLDAAPEAEAVAPKAPAAARGAVKAGKASFEPDADAKAAAAAVDAAAEALPAEDGLKLFSVRSELAAANPFAGGISDEVPPRRGRKPPPPRAAEHCLVGKTFVISGTLDSLLREEAADLVKRYGGRVTGAVSSRTSFLLVGTGCGLTKVERARSEPAVKMIDEDGLYALLRAAKPPGHAPRPKQAPRVFRDLKGGGGERELWVNKHKPQSVGDLVGNGANVRLIRTWLESWDRVHLQGGKPPLGGGSRGGKPQDLGRKAVLLCGPPGVGKTSAAHLIAKAGGYEVLEVNASDARNKADRGAAKGIGGKLSNLVKEKITNRALTAGGRTQACKSLIIMDECDGMGAGDRGGVADLADTIRRSKIPIICICNDKYSQKMRPLRNVALELDFRRPTKTEVAKRLQYVAQKEGLQVSQTTLETLAEASNGDIRLMLGQLQQVRLSKAAMTYDDAKAQKSAGKDTIMSPFDAARNLLSTEAGKFSVSERLEMVFQDADLVPLLVQENYVNHRPSHAGNALQQLKLLAKAADGISLGDLANSAVRREGNWSIMPFAGVMSSVYAGAYAAGPRTIFSQYEPNFPRFTAWLGNNSSRNKYKRLGREVSLKLRASGLCQCSGEEVATDYVPALRHVVSGPLVEHKKDGIPAAVGALQAYCLDREDYDSVLEMCTYKTADPWGADPSKLIETAVKTAFTRAVNSTAPRARAGTAGEELIVKARGKKLGKKKKKKAGADPELDPEEAEADSGEEEGEEDAFLQTKASKMSAAQMKRLNLEVRETSKPARGAKGAGRGRGRGKGRGGKSA